jgi:molecular chaperone DnaK
MVNDAEANAAEDKRMRELVDARNQAENMIHATSKSLKELDDQVEEAEKQEIEGAIEALRKAVEGEDKDDIDTKTAALAEVSGKLAERVYKQQAESGQEAGEASEGATEAPAGEAQDDVVDAEFEEVKDDK